MQPTEGTQTTHQIQGEPLVTTPPSVTNRVVVGVDGSTPSDAALRWARFLAETIGGTLQAVTIVPSYAD
jgi:hypothetical protein